MYSGKLPLMIVVVLELLRFKVDGQKACSCYTFEDGRSIRLAWIQAKASCEADMKHLVVMKTMREREFINKEIRNRTAVKYDEWHIGLFRNLTTGNWTWINGKPLTIVRWQPYNPDDRDFYALIAKEYPPRFYGLFCTIKGNVGRGWICEEETDNCLGVCMRKGGPSKMPSTARPTARSQGPNLTQTHTSTSTPPSTTTSSGTRRDNKVTVIEVARSDDLLIAVIIEGALLVLILVVAVAALAFFSRRYTWTRKKPEDKDGSIQNHRSDQSQSLEVPRDSRDPATTAMICEDPTEGSEETRQRGHPQRLPYDYATLNEATMMHQPGNHLYAQLVGSSDIYIEMQQGELRQSMDSRDEIQLNETADQKQSYMNTIVTSPEYMNI